MITVQVECECGQPYEYKVEPVNGRVPYIITCPVCGANGTAAANASLARQQPPRITNPTSALVKNPEQAEIDARAKMSWGDSPDEVTKFLMLQGYDAQTASDMVAGLTQERATAVRGNGIRKIVMGFGLICVPIAALLFFSYIKFMSLKLMGIAIAVGLWGVWLVLNGLIMLIAPKMETSDLAEQ